MNYLSPSPTFQSNQKASIPLKILAVWKGSAINEEGRLQHQPQAQSPPGRPIHSQVPVISLCLCLCLSVSVSVFRPAESGIWVSFPYTERRVARLGMVICL